MKIKIKKYELASISPGCMPGQRNPKNGRVINKIYLKQLLKAYGKVKAGSKPFS